MARAAETCGRRVETWIRGLMSANALINKATAWGGFRSDYTTCAIAACTNSRSVDFSAARCVVIGRSSTSIGALRALVGDFRVQTGRLTVVSRGRKGNGRTKALRRAAGGGEVVRVADYRDDAVVREVLDADVVVFGIDRVEPVLRRSMVLGRRDFVARPLVVFDFNGRGSTEGLAEMPGVTVYDSGLLAAAVAKQADRRCRGATFERAVVEAERMALSAVDGMDCPSSVWAETA